ncbi:MAG: glycosyltransferase [Gaiellaceae bacterium]
MATTALEARAKLIERERRVPEPATRIVPDGKFLLEGGAVFRVRGATYGSFRPRGDGEPFPESDRVEEDFLAMAGAGLNTVRTYALPPVDVLDLAAEVGLRVIVGLHYEDWRVEQVPGRRSRRRIVDAGRRAVGAAVERCAGRPEVLAVSVGNEVPGDLVRLHGIRSVEHALSELVAEIHAAGTQLLATYTNYPTTEYLHLEGQDLVCFNVFLEEPEDFEAYLRHLQVISGEVPLVITELGLASKLHGESEQADSLAWQLRVVDEVGCAGATVFSWTDEWHVGGDAVEGWGFGLTDARRHPRPALDVVRGWASRGLADLRAEWPATSVVVCARNESALVGRCLASLERCDYPRLEVIVCDDGSTDGTNEIARQFPFRLLTLEHGGLSRARNAGIEAARGEIVAFLDADAECHPEWPYHLALSLEDENVCATGGPNLPPALAPFSERVVALSPGAPVHVLITDDRAEHVPGCNMAFRKDALERIGGFDPIYTAAGDDVDVCWKLLDLGCEVGFSAAAQVRHHRPATFRDYLRQQRNYGRAERKLSGRHRHRFNALGQARWSGFIYVSPRMLPMLLRPIVYHGPMGLAPFQPVAARRSERVLQHAAPLLPLAIAPVLLGALAFLSPWWLLAPLVSLLLVLLYGAAVALAVRPARHEPRPLELRLLVGAMHVAQPFVRTWGRLRGPRAEPLPAEAPRWTGDRMGWLLQLLRELDGERCKVRPGGPHDDWDLQVSVGPLVSARLTTAVAWNWSPRVRLSFRPRLVALLALPLAVTLAALDPPVGGLALGAMALAALVEASFARRLVRGAIRRTTSGAGT